MTTTTTTPRTPDNSRAHALELAQILAEAQALRVRGASLEVLSYLANPYGARGNAGFAYASQPRIAEALGLTERTVRGAIAALVALGLLAVGAGRDGQVARYRPKLPSAPLAEDETPEAQIRGTPSEPRKHRSGVTSAPRILGSAHPGSTDPPTPEAQIRGVENTHLSPRARLISDQRSEIEIQRESGRASDHDLVVHLLDSAKRAIGRAWGNPEQIREAWDGGGLRTLRGDVDRLRAIIGWARTEPDPKASITRSIEGYAATDDPYVVGSNHTLALYASDPGKWTGPSMRPLASREQRARRDELADLARLSTMAAARARGTAAPKCSEPHAREWGLLATWALEVERGRPDVTAEEALAFAVTEWLATDAVARGYDPHLFATNPNEYFLREAIERRHAARRTRTERGETVHGDEHAAKHVGVARAIGMLRAALDRHRRHAHPFELRPRQLERGSEGLGLLDLGRWCAERSVTADAVDGLAQRHASNIAPVLAASDPGPYFEAADKERRSA